MTRPSTALPIPERLARRPRDARGLPVPWTVLLREDGTPDFRVTDSAKWLLAVERRVCALCAEPLGRHLAFVGGPLSFASRFFMDLAMHFECARYAVQVCPFIAAPNFRYAETIREVEGTTLVISEEVESKRPDRFFIGTTRDFRVVRTSQGAMLVKASPWERVEWWRHGAPIAEETAA